MTKKRIVGVIGLGHVGAHVAYALAVQGIADELILVDQKEQKLASEVQDLRDAAAYLPHRVTVRAGDFANLGECDVIVNSVGKIELLETHDRLTEMDFTIPAVRSYAHKIKESGFDGVLINITNPCDIVTRELALGVGLPRGRVFGTGTGLDTSRLLSALARQTGIDQKQPLRVLHKICRHRQPDARIRFRAPCVGLCRPAPLAACREIRRHADPPAVQNMDPDPSHLRSPPDISTKLTIWSAKT